MSAVSAVHVFLLAISALSAFTGCMPDAADAATARGAHDFQCSPARVRARWLRTTNLGEAYEVNGCGDTAKYICNDDGCTRADKQGTDQKGNGARAVAVYEPDDSPMSGSPAGPLAGGGSIPSSDALLLFGGENHRTFLGCLNCSEFDTNSVHNKFGNYGSKFSDKSIFNPFSDYGSPYSAHSACNLFADDPPVVVDNSGEYHGRLTLNKALRQVDMPMILAWLVGVCERE